MGLTNEIPSWFHPTHRITWIPDDPTFGPRSWDVREDSGCVFVYAELEYKNLVKTHPEWTISSVDHRYQWSIACGVYSHCGCFTPSHASGVLVIEPVADSNP